MDTPAQAVIEGFDVDTLDNVQEITHKCGVIFDEDGVAKSGFILASKNSVEYVVGQKQIRIDNIKRAGQRKKQIDSATDAGAEVVASTVARNDRATALSVVVGWFGFLQNGQPLTFDKGIVNKMFDKCPTWQMKVLVDLENEANFTPASSTV
jgi:hypothetical protein